MLNAMTGQLRDDILMHRVQQVVKELAFLKLLPGSLLMQVIFKLKVVIYIAGDIIFKINTIGKLEWGPPSHTCVLVLSYWNDNS